MLISKKVNQKGTAHTHTYKRKAGEKCAKTLRGKHIKKYINILYK